MTSKKPASSKRAPLPRASDYTKTFLKDWERLSRSGRYDLKRSPIAWQRRILPEAVEAVPHTADTDPGFRGMEGEMAMWT